LRGRGSSTTRRSRPRPARRRASPRWRTPRSASSSLMRCRRADHGRTSSSAAAGGSRPRACRCGDDESRRTSSSAAAHLLLRRGPPLPPRTAPASPPSRCGDAGASSCSPRRTETGEARVPPNLNLQRRHPISLSSGAMSRGAGEEIPCLQRRALRDRRSTHGGGPPSMEHARSLSEDTEELPPPQRTRGGGALCSSAPPPVVRLC
jgi:hypothetical protein